jgi:hypothetical protein
LREALRGVLRGIPRQRSLGIRRAVRAIRSGDLLIGRVV